MRKPLVVVLLALFLVLSLSTAFASAPMNFPQFSIANAKEFDGSTSTSLQPSSPPIVPFSTEYIGNSNSGIFHYSSCRYVVRMSENHKIFFESRDEAVDAGYRPCKVCRP